MALEPWQSWGLGEERTMDNQTERAEALLNGEPTFWPITPCRHGHLGPRSTADGKCLECRRATWRRWRDGNPERALANLERMLTEKGVMAE